MKIKKKNSLIILVTFLFSVFLISCNSNSQKSSDKKPLRIAISKMHRKHTYSNWLHRYDSTVQLINLYPLGIDSALKMAETVDGILITGGEDVYPDYYGKIDDTARCGRFDHYRDSLELDLIHFAIVNKTPIIGICRGEQIINVDLGGTLIIDIPTDWDTAVKHASKDWKLQWHDVNIVQGTMMEYLSQVEKGKVSSSHHQAIEKLGRGLRISAYAPDSIPEAIEWEDPDGKGFLMATQWHPEHMDTLSPLSASFAKLFLEEAGIYNNKKSH